jgi:hypothetical protein
LTDMLCLYIFALANMKEMDSGYPNSGS